jgi:PaREP1/PaREP8 domain containing family protein
VLPQFIVKELERRGLDPVAYAVEPITERADPSERARLYLEGADYFWREGLALEGRDLRHAGEKLWNSIVQLVKAVAETRGLRHDSHRLIWAVVRRIATETGDEEAIKLFAAVEQLHVNFYEGHLDRFDFEVLKKAAAELRDKLRKLIAA